MPKGGTVFSVASKAFDPHLEALFSGSAGPVKTPAKSRYSEKSASKKKGKSDGEDDGVNDDEELSEGSEELNYDDEDEENDSSDDSDSSDGEDEDDAEADAVEKSVDAEMADAADGPRRERKRKRNNDNEDLEGKYLSNLVKDEEKEHKEKRQKAAEESKDGDKSTEDDDDEEEEEDDDEDDAVPVHESIAKSAKSAEADKASRTVFLANVSTEAISSKSAKKTLMAHLSSALDSEDYPIQKIESIRFRSVAFSTGAMPKRAAYITKNLMDATTKSTNAYVVFSTDAAARRVANKLNGTEVLGRHIRVDNVAHPSPTDHRRCVFVGNLGFVDDETVVSTNSEGETERKKRNKVPADVEEGLWRTFSQHGKVENVRVIRDPKTRVGKGFAYVQFYDGNSVEAALLLDGKKFPPMLPRSLRVTRAKDPRKTAQAVERVRAKTNASNNVRTGSVYNPKQDPNQQAAAGRANKLFGRSGAASNGLPAGIKPPSHIIFEGRRASSRDALPKDLKMKQKGKGKAKKVRPTNRGARRAAEWKKKKGSAE